MPNLPQAYAASASHSLSEAASLPFEVYHDKKIYDLEVDHIFRNDWVFVCAEQLLPNPGDYFALTVAGEAIAIIHGTDGKIRALSNICRHRGTPLLDEGYGTVEKHITCPYHAWVYDQTGKFKGAPFTRNHKPEKSEHCLPAFHLESWHGLLFVNLAENPSPFAARVEGINDYLHLFEPHSFIHGVKSGGEEWQVNWKLAVENAIESYHLFKVHEETLETITPSKTSYYVAGSSEWTLTGGKMADTRSTLEKWLTGKVPEAYSHYLLIFLPPNFIGILTYGSLQWIAVLPKAAEKCQIMSGGISNEPGNDDKISADFTAAFLKEDKWICERVQQGMHSKKTTGGKLVDMEQSLIDFRQYLGSRLFGAKPIAFASTAEADLFLNPER